MAETSGGMANNHGSPRPYAKPTLVKSTMLAKVTGIVVPASGDPVP